LIIGVAALGFNLRGPITSLPPVYPEIQSELGLSTAPVSLLAATPVICFGMVSAFAAWLSRRLGEERVLLAAAAVLTCGLLLRGLWPGAMLFPGTVLASSAIAVMNVLLSSLSKRRWPSRVGLLIGIYLTALSLGAVTGSLLSVPLYQASGGSVRLVLGWIALPAALGSAVAWVLILGVGQGAALALAIFFTIARAPDPVSAASLSSLAQAVGYLVASAGPLELGLLHSATGSWDLPVAVLFVLNGCLFAAGMMAGRPRVLPSRVALADTGGGLPSVQYKRFLYSERTVVLLRSSPISIPGGQPRDGVW